MRDFKAKSFTRGDHSPRTSGERPRFEEKRRPPPTCVMCKGPHHIKNCPKLGTLAALAEERERETRKEEEVEHCSSLQLLGALNLSKPKEDASTNGGKGLMYVAAKVNGKPAEALMDSGATHNFITEAEAKTLGLKIGRAEGRSSSSIARGASKGSKLSHHTPCWHSTRRRHPSRDLEGQGRFFCCKDGRLQARAWARIYEVR